jgi:hypothetical protein
MSAEENRIAKRASTAQGTVAIGVATGASGLPMSSTTVMVTLSVPPGADVWLNFGAAAAVGTGIKIPGSGQPVTMTLKDFGGFVQSSPQAIATVATQMGYIILNSNDGF